MMKTFHICTVAVVLCTVFSQRVSADERPPQETGGLQFRPDSEFMVSPACLNETQLPCYRDGNGNGQIFHAPIAIGDMSRFREVLESAGVADEQELLEVPLTVYLTCEQLKKEIAEELSRKGEGISHEHVMMAPIRVFEIFAIIAGREQLIFSSAPSRPSASHATPQKVRCVLRGTREELKQWAEWPDMTCYGHLSAFKAVRNELRVTLDDFMKSEESRRLFGDDNLTNKVEFHSSNRSAGMMVSLGPVRLGGKSGDQRSVVDRKMKRFVSRNQLQTALMRFTTRLRASVWLEDREDVDTLHTTMQQFLNAAFGNEERTFYLKVVDRRLHVLDTVTNTAIDAGSIDAIAAQHGDVLNMQSNEKKEFAVGPLKASGTNEKKLEGSSTVQLTQGGSIRIPAHVNLVQIDRSTFEKSFEATFNVIKATRQSFTIHTRIDPELEIHEGLLKGSPDRLQRIEDAIAALTSNQHWGFQEVEVSTPGHAPVQATVTFPHEVESAVALTSVYARSFGRDDHHVKSVHVEARVQAVNGQHVQLSCQNRMNDDSGHRAGGSMRIVVLAKYRPKSGN